MLSQNEVSLSLSLILKGYFIAFCDILSCRGTVHTINQFSTDHEDSKLTCEIICARFRI